MAIFHDETKTINWDTKLVGNSKKWHPISPFRNAKIKAFGLHLIKEMRCLHLNKDSGHIKDGVFQLVLLFTNFYKNIFYGSLAACTGFLFTVF